jgi:endonuclease/exonuclease/phosphatase family metal-dependent hydrolase
VPFGLLLAPTQRLTARADDAVLRVMTYNIHQGIDNRGYVALEWMAQTIEGENPDIVLLQEVTRSALVNGGIDSIEWLSRRLGMPYHFFAADRQFGNATLTRLPIVSANAGLLPRNDEALNRNYVRVVVQVDGETITVINTHLDHMQRDNRMPQVERVIEIWGGEARTVMGGDLNAQPHSDEINALLAAGMVSGQDVTGNGALDTFIAFDPFLRLDWLFGSPDIRFIQSRVPESIASDHLPVVVEIALPLGN